MKQVLKVIDKFNKQEQIKNNPNNNGLPAYRYGIGSLHRIGETVELALPQNIEFFLKEHSAGKKGLNVTSANNKLRITLTKAPDIVNGPYGTFDLYIRSNNIFTVDLIADIVVELTKEEIEDAIKIRKK